jgi:hypothetical protein
MAEPRTWTVSFPPPAPWLNANKRYKRRPSETIRAWRDAAHQWAKSAKLPKGLAKVHIMAELRFSDDRRRDSSNYADTLKPITDGLIDYGLVEDDDRKHVIGPDIRIGGTVPKRRLGVAGLVVLTITELSGASDG